MFVFFFVELFFLQKKTLTVYFTFCWFFVGIRFFCCHSIDLSLHSSAQITIDFKDFFSTFHNKKKRSIYRQTCSKVECLLNIEFSRCLLKSESRFVYSIFLFHWTESLQLIDRLIHSLLIYFKKKTNNKQT